MEKRATDGYIFLGTAIRYMMHVHEGHPIFGAGFLFDNVEDFEKKLAQYEFHVTDRVAAELWALLRAWERELAEHSDDEDWIKARTLTSDEQSKIWRAASTARDTVLAEAAGRVAFIATDKRYTVEKLIDDIGSLMNQGVFEELPELAKFDLREGGRALAFDLPTAAAFHFLRATEEVLRHFYLCVVKRNRIAEPRMWAAMVRDMRGKRNAPSALLLDNLDSLRSHFRNPTQHPEKTYDLDETQDLLALAIDSINRMVKHKLALSVR